MSKTKTAFLMMLFVTLRLVLCTGEDGRWNADASSASTE